MTRTGQVILATCFWSIVLAASYTLAADPTTAECLSANESSLGLRSQHKLRDARAKLLICSAPSCPADVRDECIRGVNEINAAVPTIVFEARDPTGADLGAVKVRMDGELLVESLEGTALSIDPGTHTFSFETSGQPKVEKQFLIREGEKDRRERIMFGAPAVAVAPVAGAEATPPGTTLAVSPSTTTTEPPSHGLGAQRIGALIAGGVGVVGIGIGIGYALDSRSKHDSATQVCPDPQCPAGSNGVDLWNQAISAGNVSTVAFIVGAAGLAGAATLWFTATPESSGGTSTQVGFGPRTLQVRGSW
jgi:hypothetical protein